MTDASILYKRYNTCICSYLSSGVRGLRYRYEAVNGVRIFYPYVIKEQFDRNQKRQEVIPVSSCRDKSVGDYATFDWFKKCFTIEGNANLKFDYLVYISDGKAGYVPLRHNVVFRGGLGRHYDGKYYNDLQFCLMRDLSIGAMDFHGYSVYYRIPFKTGFFMVDIDEHAPFEIMFPLLASGYFNRQFLFMNYALSIVPEYTAKKVNAFLDTNRVRFINGVSKHWKQGVAREILSKEWCFHTKLLFEEEANKGNHTKQQNHIIDMVLQYCDKRLSKSKLVNMRSGVPHFDNVELSEEKVCKLYTALVQSGSIEPNISEGEFLFYLKGVGTEVPSQKIVWKETITRLSYLLKQITNKDENKPTEWRTAAHVFESSTRGELRDTVLKNAYQQSISHAKNSFTLIRFYEELISSL